MAFRRQGPDQKGGATETYDLKPGVTGILPDSSSLRTDFTSPEYDAAISAFGACIDHAFWRPPGSIPIEIMSKCRGIERKG